MPGWTRRYLFHHTPFLLPEGVRLAGFPTGGKGRYAVPLACLALTFLFAAGARFLEAPFWDSPVYRLGDELLFATHDAYHWVAGAEAFEFGAGHPMSELARITALAFNTSQAKAAFWLPPFLSGLLAVAIFLWGWGLGQPYAGMCAGVAASLAPAFCARTLLGFYDTDLIVLLFAVLLGLIPALWLTPWLTSPLECLFPRLASRIAATGLAASGSAQHGGAQAPPGGDAEKALILLHAHAPARPLYFGPSGCQPGELCLGSDEMRRSMLPPAWLIALVLSGLFGWWTQAWHSLFPYLVRFSALAIPALIFFFGPRNGRKHLLNGALCHCLPLVAGPVGAALGGMYALTLIAEQRYAQKPALRDFPFLPLISRLATHPAVTILLWSIVAFFTLDNSVIDTMIRSFYAYVDRSGDAATLEPMLADPVVFPSVAQSIIELQTVSLRTLLIYVYPVEAIAMLCLILFVWRLCVTPALIWFVPLFALTLFSLRAGARMTIFAPPFLLFAFCLEGGLVLRLFLHRIQWNRLLQAIEKNAKTSGKEKNSRLPVQRARSYIRWGKGLTFAAALFLLVALSWPLAKLLPNYAQGPIISREHAEALAYLRAHSPEDGIVWEWWDWGYATHHFAHRHAIADGARHGGPSLYLPAAAYTTASPRFARQLIKYTASKENIPGQVFAGLSAPEAQQLMRSLGNRQTPLIDAPGKQYIVVSFDLIRLGLWVTRYGSWNFETKEGPGALMNNLTPALRLNLETGVIFTPGDEPVYAASIAVFNPGGIERHNYNRYGAYHFFFNTQPITRGGADGENAVMAYLRNAWTGNTTFPSQINDKIVMDDVFFNTMMVQLLLRPAEDPFISPYFKLLFDNGYARVYEVL